MSTRKKLRQAEYAEMGKEFKEGEWWNKNNFKKPNVGQKKILQAREKMEDNRGHVHLRSFQRANLQLTQQYYDRIVSDIQQGNATFIKNQFNERDLRSVWEVFLAGALRTVVYSSKTKRIITLW